MTMDIYGHVIKSADKVKLKYLGHYKGKIQFCHHFKEKRGLSVNEKPRHIKSFIMLVTGLEPATPSLRVKCTTSCATPA